MSTRDLLVMLGGAGMVALTTGTLRAVPGVSHTTVALALLLVVLATATIARLRIAILVSILAMLTLNFFFLPPVGTFTIADPQNWIALVAFLAVAIVGSKLSAAAQDRAREADARRHEVTRLFELTRDVLLTTETAGAVEELARHVGRRFDLSGVAICLPSSQGWQIHQGGPDAIVVDVIRLNAALADARGSTVEHGVSIVALRQGTRAVGLLAARSRSLGLGTLDAIAGVVAIAIERTEFLAERDAAALVRQKADLAATLLASLSHDLRTPLTVIRVAVENLGGDLRPGDRRQQTGAAIVELERLTCLLQDILDMARIDAAAIRIDRQWVGAADVVDAAVAHVGHALKGHALRVDAGNEMAVELDPRLVSMALAHLLENAARYSPADREILVLATVERDGLHVSVSDDGAGLDPDELDHLFERFYRGRSARQATFGTGMGLSITRGLLAAVGGRVWAENVPGAGARFTLVVPGPVRSVAVAN
jgi:two-component system, OmpR family, sensor histidine kinase KdpD